MKRFYLALLSAGLLIASCTDTGGDLNYPALKNKATDYKGAIAHEWMEMGFHFIQENELYGPHAARIYGYLGLTCWESVYNGVPNANSLEGQINDYQEAAFIDRFNEYDWGIVLCSAMRVVFPELVDNITNAQRSQVNLLADQQESEMMDKGLTQQVRVNSVDLGSRIGLRIVERIHSDGRDVISSIVPITPQRDTDHPWYWDTESLTQEPIEPLWGTLRTFIIDDSRMCEAEGPFPYSETPGSDLYQDALEVYNIERSPFNKAIAYHWENGADRTCSSACHWIAIARQILQDEGADLAKTAKVYAYAGLTVADSYSSSWYVKYKYFMLRPETYIREQIDPSWNPLVFTPPHPDYSSASTTVAGSASIVLADLLGDIPFRDRTHLGSPLYTPDGGPFVLPERQFTSITKAGEEQMIARIIAGTSFRRSCEMGFEAGKCIGSSVLTKLDTGF